MLVLNFSELTYVELREIYSTNRPSTGIIPAYSLVKDLQLGYRHNRIISNGLRRALYTALKRRGLAQSLSYHLKTPY